MATTNGAVFLLQITLHFVYFEFLLAEMKQITMFWNIMKYRFNVVWICSCVQVKVLYETETNCVNCQIRIV